MFFSRDPRGHRIPGNASTWITRVKTQTDEGKGGTKAKAGQTEQIPSRQHSLGVRITCADSPVCPFNVLQCLETLGLDRYSESSALMAGMSRFSIKSYPATLGLIPSRDMSVVELS